MLKISEQLLKNNAQTNTEGKVSTCFFGIFLLILWRRKLLQSFVLLKLWSLQCLDGVST